MVGRPWSLAYYWRVQVPPSGIGKSESYTYYSGDRVAFEAHRGDLESVNKYRLPGRGRISHAILSDTDGYILDSNAKLPTCSCNR